LESLGIHPRKALSQNFLIDGNIIRKIVAAADVVPGETVIEIGPGPGSLTEALLAAGAEVFAIEKDPTLARALRRLEPDEKQLHIFPNDVLEIDFTRFPKSKVIANLPYNITTPILERLITQPERFSRLVLMVQEEVARRFTALPHAPEYGSITLFLNFYSIPRYCFQVNPTCFYPAPKVHSAIVEFTLHSPPLVDAVQFFKLTRTAFQQRRKMMRGSLKEAFPHIIEALAKAGLSPEARPEQLSLEQFLHLYHSIIFCSPKK